MEDNINDYCVKTLGRELSGQEKVELNCKLDTAISEAKTREDISKLGIVVPKIVKNLVVKFKNNKPSSQTGCKSRK